MDINKILNKWNITYFEFSFNSNLALTEQLDVLKEDLIQAENNNKILDVGWYPEFQANGNFMVCIVQDFDWDNLLFKKEANSFDELCEILREVNNLSN